MSCVSVMYRRLLATWFFLVPCEWEACLVLWGVLCLSALLVPERVINCPKRIGTNSCTKRQGTHRSPTVLSIPDPQLAFQPLDDALSLAHAHSEPDRKTALVRLSHVLRVHCGAAR